MDCGNIRLDVATGTLMTGPVLLEYRMSGLSAALLQLATLNRLIGLSRTGRMAPSLFPLERRAKRWALVLRTWDALAAGMGLMQLMPETWTTMRRQLGLGGNPHNPRDNILAGSLYLRLMYDKFG